MLWPIDHPEDPRVAAEFERLSPVHRVGLGTRMEHLGMRRIEDFLAFFGAPSLRSLIEASRQYAGPVWYHGTSEQAAATILSRGFRLDLLGSHADSWGLYGAGCYFGSLYEALYYGPVIIAVRLTCPVAPWEGAKCQAARRACRWPLSTDIARWDMDSKTDRCRALARAMCARGVFAVLGRNAFNAELVAFRSRVIRLLGGGYATDYIIT